jgi:hypothetical protein
MSHSLLEQTYMNLYISQLRMTVVVIFFIETISDFKWSGRTTKSICQFDLGLKNSTRANPRPQRPFYSSSEGTSLLRPDIGPAIPYSGPTRPPLAGPYAFSRFPRAKLSPHRIFLSDVKQLPAPTWIFSNHSTGYFLNLSSCSVYIPVDSSITVLFYFSTCHLYEYSTFSNTMPISCSVDMMFSQMYSA